ncbi:MAG: hypothetical protein AABZ08_12415 [Planctomycetota bacterium]
MDWNIIRTSILTSFGGVALGIAIAWWLGKKWVGTRIEHSVRHEYDKKLELFKVDLQQVSSEAIRKLELDYQESINEKAADKDLFRRFLLCLPSTGSIEFIRDHDYAGGSFDRDRHEDLENFVTNWDNTEHEFLDCELEEKRQKLMALVNEFLHTMARDTFSVNNSISRASIPPEWRYEQSDRFKETTEAINKLVSDVVKKHSDIVRTGRVKLKL